MSTAVAAVDRIRRLLELQDDDGNKTRLVEGVDGRPQRIALVEGVDGQPRCIDLTGLARSFSEFQQGLEQDKERFQQYALQREERFRAERERAHERERAILERGHERQRALMEEYEQKSREEDTRLLANVVEWENTFSDDDARHFFPETFNALPISDCVICHSEINPGPNHMRTHCNHVFHKDCLIQWMSVRMECPLCRMYLPSDV